VKWWQKSDKLKRGFLKPGIHISRPVNRSTVSRSSLNKRSFYNHELSVLEKNENPFRRTQ
jgi:hypothetical protein